MLAQINRTFPRPNFLIKRFWLKEKPEGYLQNEHTNERTRFLLNKIKGLGVKTVLELGCNCGRNLAELYRAGYKTSGIEINPKAINLMRDVYPEVYRNSTIQIKDLKDIKQEKADLTFTMAVLEHVPGLNFLKNIQTKYFITIEDELGEPRYWYFKRNYRKEFEKRGYTQVEEMNLSDVIDERFVYRLFKCDGHRKKRRNTDKR